jgi:hypothetical protein
VDDDQARFDCIVSNPAGSFTSPGARLMVREWKNTPIQLGS